MTHDVLLTLSLLLERGAGGPLPGQPCCGSPRSCCWSLFGALLGPSALDVVDVPLDSLGAQLMFTLGVSLILFYGGLNLSLPRPAPGLGRARDARHPRGGPDGGWSPASTAHLAFDLSWTAALLMGAVLSPTDPAILIPLFVRSRLRPKVAQTVVAESAFNDPTGAVLALALAGVLLSGDSSLATPGRATSSSTSRSAP